ncbi:hypothetical protein A9Q83_08565 [Alphaproteobacteria bacterium 46_93_T64]|nr:hypothetical protein A9Q83_08565 [Alphaproteobacteria bacterium 46_93_T64]
MKLLTDAIIESTERGNDDIAARLRSKLCQSDDLFLMLQWLIEKYPINKAGAVKETSVVAYAFDATTFWSEGFEGTVLAICDLRRSDLEKDRKYSIENIKKLKYLLQQLEVVIDPVLTQTVTWKAAISTLDDFSF